MKKGLMLLACCTLLGLVGCGGDQPNPEEKPGDDTPGETIDDGGMNFEENDDFVPELLHYSIVGNSFANWDTGASAADENLVFEKVDSYTYSLTVDVTTDDMFKIIKDGTWDVQYGMEDLNWDKCTAGLITEGEYNGPTTNRTNITVTHDAKIKIDVHPFYVVEDGFTGALVITEVK